VATAPKNVHVNEHGLPPRSDKPGQVRPEVLAKIKAESYASERTERAGVSSSRRRCSNATRN
jgi:hypothetical protein